MYVSQIQPSNRALEFIDRRLLDNSYRGTKSSQQNRYDMSEIYEMLTIMDKYSPNKTLMRIRDTDLSKRPQNTPDEEIYARFCENVKEKVGKGTQDSIRKNILVDIHRMGLINRYDGNKTKLDAFASGSVKYVSLSDDGMKFIKSSLLDRAYIFTKALDVLLGGYAEISLELLKDDERNLGRITKYEFMFFVSAINTDTTFNITTDECVELIRSYRMLSRIQQKAVIETLKQKLKPGLFSGNKIKQRDWHNWQNKIDQAYHLFKQTPYFDVSGPDKDILTLSTRRVVTKAGEILDLPKRSIAEKFAYFTNHTGIKKTPGYELHHVVPLSWSESPEQYKLFDTWKNMVYIDAYTHAKITQNRNRNVNMSANDNGFVLSDFSGNRVELIKDLTILYNVLNQPIMLYKNKELLTTIS